MIRGLAFTWHVPALIALLVVAVVFTRFSLARGRLLSVYGALVATAAVLVWPMGDLARRVSLSATVIQRLVLMLLFVPVLLRSVPASVVERITRPRVLDSVTYQLARPLSAIATVTIVGTLTVTPAAVDWSAQSGVGNAVVIIATIIAGVILWVPALGVLPGSRHLSQAGRAGYLFASALVVTSLSFIWIFATHSLYPGLSGQEEVLGVTPLFDQQMAGFIAKLGAYAPLWAISFYIFSKVDDGARVEESPLHWADVERHLLRVDRQRARQRRRIDAG